jgi:hypothetical protein
MALITQLLGESIGLGGAVVSLVSFALVTYANRSGHEMEREQSAPPARQLSGHRTS